MLLTVDYRTAFGHLAVDQVVDGQSGNARHFLARLFDVGPCSWNH